MTVPPTRQQPTAGRQAPKSPVKVVDSRRTGTGGRGKTKKEASKPWQALAGLTQTKTARKTSRLAAIW